MSSHVSIHHAGHDAGPNGARLKPVLWAALILTLVLAVSLALVLGWGRLIRPSCTTGVVIVTGPHGEKLECVCVGGVQATCFEAGP